MMSSTLRSCLLALVILNLVFVHITQVVSLSWIVPLYLAAAGAPLFWRLQHSLSYQMMWNAGLLAIFVLLLQHLVHEGGVRYLLEDGLRLAAFCQVHVLNNLGRQKRPDLIFFNSFLIALVTSLFCQDLVYSVVFVIFAMVLVLSLQVAATEVKGSRLSPSLAFEIRSSLRHSAIGLAITMLVFICWPRDFEREGLVEERLLGSQQVSEIGFSEQIRLDHRNRAVAADTVVLRAELESGDKDAVPPHWRGITYTRPVHGGWGGENRWQSPRRFSLDNRWLREGDGSWYRKGYETLATLTVEVVDRSNRRAFAPLAVHRLDIPGIAYPKLDGNFKLIQHWKQRHEALTYRMEVGREVLRRNNRSYIEPGRFAGHLSLPDDMVPDSASRLYERLGRGLPPDAAPREVADRFARHLAANYDYLLPGEEGAARDLDDFVRRGGGGHCEYFASLMMILLRKHDIPCRLVGGYLAHEWSEDGKTLTIRQRHAHAWVEAWDRTTGWFTVDATPAHRAMADRNSRWRITAMISALWDKIRDFDAKTRDAALAALGDTIKAIGRWWWRHPLLMALVAALAVVLFRLYRRWRAPFRDPAVADYVSTLRRVGVEPQDAETPRQLLARARAMELAPARLEMLAAATAEHERRRYSSASTDAR